MSWNGPIRVCIGIIALATLSPGYAADGPLSPEETAAKMNLPEGFKATVFAAEPDIAQPIAMAFDDKGRVWVVECHSYPAWSTTTTDRVVVLEDTDGDGKHDKRTVFLDKQSNLTSVEIGHGGVWLTSPPNLLFVPDADGDARPDGPAQVMLDGWATNAQHNVVNGLSWGPDGWLYGCHGILTTSKIGVPGTPDDKRVAINCGVWRFHPTRKVVEAFASGLTNPWGLAWDRRGELFATNCVIPHLFHIIPGGRYARMFGQDLHPYSYDLIASCADHIHWAGGAWESSRNAEGGHDAAGGGHAHCGAMIYQGENWPANYRDGVYTCNIHGRRLNHDRLERKGSGYNASHSPDIARASDPWMRSVAVKYGPDGGVYIVDWNDDGECHDYDVVRRETGRIYKVVYGTPQPFKQDLAALRDAELLPLLNHHNGWLADHARRLLQERGATRSNSSWTRAELRRKIANPKSPDRLQAIWTHHAIGGLSDAERAALLGDADDTIRGWAVRLELEDNAVPATTMAKLISLAQNDPSPYVRLQLAAGLQRLGLEERRKLALPLIARAEDAGDANIPLMLWYGTEPLLDGDDADVLAVGRAATIPTVREFLARKLASATPPRLSPVLALLESSQDAAATSDILRGLHSGLEGRRGLAPPEGWGGIAKRCEEGPDASARDLAREIGLIFGDERAFEAIRQLALDPAAKAEARTRALATLVTTKRPEVAGWLIELLADAALRAPAIRGLAAFDREGAAEAILKVFADLSETERRDAVATLIARPRNARVMLDAIGRGAFDPSELSQFDRRQLSESADPAVREQAARVASSVSPTSEERAKQIAAMKKMIQDAPADSVSAVRGREVFRKQCSGCHILFGEGRAVGPELTGSQRSDIDYLVLNLMDPNALVGFDYQITQIVTTDGRVLGGVVKAEDDATITLETATERVVVPKADVEDRRQNRQSMMPEGLLERLSPEDVRDLVKYLGSPTPLP